MMPLTTGQLQLVQDAAGSVAALWRERFLAAVADQLQPLGELDDASVKRTIAHCLQRYAPEPPP